MPHRGYIALWRKSLDSRIFHNEGLWKVWTWCLLKASHKKRWTSLKTGRGIVEIEILPGQFVFGRNSAAKELKMVPSTVWKRIVKLKNLSNLNIESNKQYSIINIINWDIYQIENNKSNSKSNMQVTCKEHASDTDNNVDNVNNEKDTAFNNAEFYITKKKRKITGKRLETFMLFWEAFDYKQGKAEATDVWLDIPALTDKIVDEIVTAAKSETKRRPSLKASGKTPKMAQGWLSGRRWEDETEKQESENHKQPLSLKEIEKLNE